MMNSDILKMNAYWADDPESETCYVEMYYDEKYVARIWQDPKTKKTIIDFPARESVESFVLRTMNLDTFSLLLEVGEKVLQGEARFDCGVYEEYR